MGIPDRASGVEVLFEDDHLIATVKPAAMPTANAPAGRPSLFTWLKKRLGQDAFVGVVSRLDAAVSGIVVFAKTPRAAAHLSEQFRDRRVEKVYSAIVTGRFPGPLNEWQEWNDRLFRPEGHGRPTEIASAGLAASQEAQTRARVVRRSGEVSLVEMMPLTGRRHQLRIQLASRGCPIVGDRLYRSRLPFPVPGGIALHATRLTVEHPETAVPLRLAASVPSPWRERFGHLVAHSGTC